MKKGMIWMLVLLVFVGSITGCGKSRDAEHATKKISVVTTIFPEYDWVNCVLGENPGDVEVTMLLDNGVDLHSYQPTAQDILKISLCDLFIYVGGESDSWVDAALGEAQNKDMIVIDLMETLGDAVKEEELVEGMQGEEEEEEGKEEGPEYDEHVWLSLRNSEVLVKSIAEAMIKIDPANEKTYQENADAYTGKLQTLDAAYEEAVSNAKFQTILFGDRFPFRYLTDDYDLDYYAAFVGCSAETEASFETITFLASKVDELHLSKVLTIEGSDHRIAQTIISATKTKDQTVLSMNSMQAITSDDVKNGVTYLSVMEKNLEVLRQALGTE